MKICLVYALFLARSSQPAENVLPESGDKSIENCVRENSWRDRERRKSN